MRLTEILKPQDIKVPLKATTKSEAIAELVDVLKASGYFGESNTDKAAENGKKVLDAVMEREATRTTGIGNGLAIPHGKGDGVKTLVMAIGRAAAPIDFQAIDGRPVTIIWMLASPRDMTGPHIHALARISRLMTIDKFRHAMMQAKTPQEAYDLIVAQENAL